jgi:peptide/nickel transport system ATP-binding protein
VSLLEIDSLSLTIGATTILKDVSLSLDPGEVLGVVGESGSGKSMTALSIMRLLPDGARLAGKLTVNGIDILAATEDAMCRLRGNDIGMVFQEPMTALNPVKTIGEQVAEGIRWHRRVSRAEAEESARRILDRVGLPEARFPLSRFPHQLSGGQRQRVVIAIACALKPKLLIADEPTTALDVVLQAQILDLLRDLVDETKMGLLLISHDLAVVTDMADRIAIMKAGSIVDTGETARVLSEQSHPYTRQLTLASTHVPARQRPTLPPVAKPTAAGAAAKPLSQQEAALSRAGGATLLSVENITRDYPGHRSTLFRKSAPVRAVDDVSFAMDFGQSVALVGRSGCGKSTLARMILALDPPTSGTIRFMGETITGRREGDIRAARRNMQVVFQDPYGSFDPRQRVERLVSEPLNLLDTQPTHSRRRDMVVAALAEVGLLDSDLEKFAHEFSGGQRQRLSIARAIITRPKLVVADEPVSALDVSIRAQILDLFADLNGRLGIAFLFITHDLTVARAITDQVMVMHDARIVERGDTRAVLDHPQSEAAQALVAAAPDLHRSIARKMQEQG